MTRYDNTYDVSVAAGTAMTPANSGGTAGAAFTQVPTGAGCTQNYVADTFHGGTKALAFSHASGVANYHGWLDLAGAAGTKHWAARGYWDCPAAPTAEDYLMMFRTGTGAAANACSLKITTGGLLRMFNAGGTASVLQTGTGVTWTSGTKIRFDMEALIAASPTTTNGFFVASWFIADSNTPGGTITSSAFDLGSVPITQVRFGRGAAVTGTWSGTMHDVAAETVASGILGPPAVPPPTPAAIILNKTEIDMRTSVPTAGGALTYSAVQFSGPTVTPEEIQEGRFFVVPDASTNLVYDITVTEAGGSSAVYRATVQPLSAAGAVGHAIVQQMVGGVLV